MALRVLSLCSGIGGIELGLRLALGDAARCVGYVERDAYAASVLLARMEDEALERAPVWCGDIADLDARPLRGHVDLLCGGYPCQPFSVAGKQLGERDPRHLWPQFVRVIDECQPALVFLENVAGHLRLGFSDVLADLARLGFDAEWDLFRASDVGAPHRRERLFCLALGDADLPRLPERHDGGGVPGFPSAWPPGPAGDWSGVEPECWPATAQPDVRRVADGPAARVERLRALGNGVVPVVAAAAWRVLAERAGSRVAGSVACEQP